MDAQSRGRSDDIDPADQWVRNPQTGEYELRLNRKPRQPAGARPQDASARPAAPGPRSDPAEAERGAKAPAGDRQVPGQRGRRAAEPRGESRTAQPRAGGRAARSRGESRTAEAAGPGRRKRKKAGGKKKALLWTGGTMGFVLVAAGVGAYLVYDRLNGNIDSIDIGDAAKGGSLKDGPINVLLLGTDRRTGKGNESYGDRANSTGHADTTLLLHVSEDRTNATVLSIPRDLRVDIPDCPTKQPDGSEKVIPGKLDTRFNESLGVAGRDPGCTIRTVEAMSGIPANHFMMADFNAVKDLTTAMDGVEVCLDKPIKDKDSKLDLGRGEHTVQGEQALAFVRNRHGLGNESDLDRIKMQQQFVASMIRKMKTEVLGSPTRMFDLADAATKALTVDQRIGDIPKLTELAKELGKVDIKNMTFTTVPVKDNPAERVAATVVLDETKAPQVFSMIQNDVSFTEVEKKEKKDKAAARSKQAKLLVGPRAEAADVRVDVYNGSGVQGAAQKTLDWLQNTEDVLKSSNKSNAPEKLAKTALVYGPNQADQARKLADLMGLPATALKPTAQDAPETRPMSLTLGADFKGPGVPITGPGKAPKDIQRVEADKKICAQ
ncbi:LCP family protein [Streptomyces uncialis]|uniref:LCP family protein n=1 Tax=Streptomyces uncialis TaxID=1048205 RepID=UPI0022599AD5|nr:LCP family protein [Streptomyces uncialis]MCX4660983.1 LCP family protein [Streptomyces uncialis]